MRVRKAADMSGVAHSVDATHVQSKTRSCCPETSAEKSKRQACAWCQGGVPFARVLGEILNSASMSKLAGVGASFVILGLPLPLRSCLLSFVVSAGLHQALQTVRSIALAAR